MKITLYTANCVGKKANTCYPDKCEITTPEDMDKAVILDHVCALYKNNIRSADNFIESDVVVMDCDNDHSDKAEDWITPEKLDEMLPDVAFVTVPSRHDNLPKDNKSARPRFHAYFSVNSVSNADQYCSIKKTIHQNYPFFDGNALDAARFIFGSDRGTCHWHDGWMCIDEILSEVPVAKDASCFNRVITEGNRNNTLSVYAGRILKRFGDSDRALDLFLKKANCCEPPLEDCELQNIWNSAIKFFKTKVCIQEGYVEPQQFNNDFANQSLKPDDYSDIGQARVLFKAYSNEMKYTDGTDYIRFDGQKWNESRQQSVGAAEEFLDFQLEDAKDEMAAFLDALEELGVDKGEAKAGGKKFAETLNEKQLKQYVGFLSAKTYFDFVMQRRNMKYIVSALQAAKPMFEIKMSDLDKNEFLLNTPGVTYDLRQGLEGGKNPDPEDLITKQTAVSPGDTGKDLWRDALNLFFCSDQELIDYVQQIAGLAAIGKVFVEALIISYGEGSNGKSTFWNTISRVLGTYSGSMSADALTVGCKRNVKPEMAELKGKRLIIAAELEEGMRLNTSIIKQLCSTDEITAEKKYKDPFKFVPSHTLVLYTNHLPRVGANDSGTWRRLIVIPFNAKITGNSDIKNYSDYLFNNAGPAILSWIIEGAQKVIQKDFHIEYPKCVSDAIAAYKETNNWLGMFLEEECVVGPVYRQKSGELYQEYRAYCFRNGEYTRSTADFYSGLESAGFERKKTSEGVFINGLSLKDKLLI